MDHCGADGLIEAVADVNANVIVILSAGSGGGNAVAFQKVPAVVHGYLGGQAGASAMLQRADRGVQPIPAN